MVREEDKRRMDSGGKGREEGKLYAVWPTLSVRFSPPPFLLPWLLPPELACKCSDERRAGGTTGGAQMMPFLVFPVSPFPYFHSIIAPPPSPAILVSSLASMSH